MWNFGGLISQFVDFGVGKKTVALGYRPLALEERGPLLSALTDLYRLPGPSTSRSTEWVAFSVRCESGGARAVGARWARSA